MATTEPYPVSGGVTGVIEITRTSTAAGFPAYSSTDSFRLVPDEGAIAHYGTAWSYSVSEVTAQHALVRLAFVGGACCAYPTIDAEISFATGRVTGTFSGDPLPGFVVYGTLEGTWVDGLVE
jgi:hypothetical protein